MPENDFYPEASGEDSASESPQSSKDSSSDYDTFLVPKSAFGESEPNPGDKETIEVVHVYEDEIECRCTGGKEESPKKSTMDEAMDDMGSMTKEG